MKILNLLLLILFAIGCKSPEARRPVSQNSGSYIDESVEKNKEMIAQEEDYIKQEMGKSPDTEFITSADGFWYYYNDKSTDSLNTETPEFGDIVVFEIVWLCVAVCIAPVDSTHFAHTQYSRDYRLWSHRSVRPLLPRENHPFRSIYKRPPCLDFCLDMVTS